MKKLFVMGAWFCVLALFGSLQLSYAQTPGQTTIDKTSQLANDFCAEFNRAQASGQTTTDKTSQLAKDFCTQLSASEASGQPVRIALAQSSSQPTRLGLAQTSSDPTRLAAAQIPGQQPADKTAQMANDFHFTIGYRNWFHSWTTPGKVSVFNALTLETTSDGIGYIPTAGVRYKDFFVSASGFFSNEYSADLIGFFDLHSKRREADVNVGYFIHPWIALSAGFKHIDMDFTISGITSSLFHAKYAYNGPTLGASVSIPIPEGGWMPSGFTVYGNGAGGYLWTHGNTQANFGSQFQKASLASDHSFYGVLEGGLAYKIASLPVALTAGYKFQALNMVLTSPTAAQFSGRHSQTDVMRGPILGVSYIQ